MNKFVFGSLLILFSSAIVAPAARAEKTVESPELETRAEEVQQSVDEDSSSSSETEAFDFVTSAYQGQYKDQGIPGFNELSTAYKSGELTAEDLVMMGVDKGILDSEMLDDEKYINGVDTQLQTLEDS